MNDGGDLSATGALTAGAASTVRVEGAGSTFDAAGTAAISGADFVARNGGSLDLASATSYAAGASNRSLLADGAAGSNSQLDLSGITSIDGSTGFNARLSIAASGGGDIDLFAATAVNSGTVHVSADGTGSTVDLSSLTTFTDTNPNSSSLIEARNGGHVETGGLATLDGVNLTLDDCGTISDLNVLTTYHNGTIVVRGTSTTADFSSLTDADQSTIIADEGAALALAGLTSYSAGASNRTLRAGESFTVVPPGGTLDLSTVTTVNGATGFLAALFIEAERGGTVELENVTGFSVGTVRVRSTGTGSVVDLLGLTSFSDSNPNSTSSIEAFSGGHLETGGLTSLDDVNLTVANGGTISDLPLLTTYNNGTITVRGTGTTADLSGLTNADAANIVADEGAALALAGLTSYSAGASNRTLRAGESFTFVPAGGTLDLSTVTTVNGATGFLQTLTIEAQRGGTVELENVPAFSVGSVRVRSVGTDSRVDLSSLTSFADSNASGSSAIEAFDGGHVETGGLPALDDVNLTLANGGTISDLPTLGSFHRATILVRNANTVADFSGLTNADEANLIADSGGTLALPSLTSYAAGAGNRTLRAGDASTFLPAGGTLDLSAVTSVDGATGFLQTLTIEAQRGGTVDLGGATSLANGAYRVTAVGTGSTIDLSSLSTLSDTITGTTSTIEAKTGGTILFNAAGTTSISNATVTLEPTGTILGDTLALATGGVLKGTGTLGASLTNPGGIVSPGTSPGIITIDGDFEQSGTGRTLFEIGGLTAETQYDQLMIEGAASLGGVFDVDLIDEFTPLNGDFFDVLIAGSIFDAGFTLDAPPLGGGLMWQPMIVDADGGDQALRLLVTPVPEPSSLSLAALGAAALLAKPRCRIRIAAPQQPVA